MLLRQKVLVTTWQPANLPKLLTNAKFELLPILKQIEQVRFFPCTDCIYHKNIYFNQCLSFTFKAKNKLMVWHYKRFFNCFNKSLMYLLICNNWLLFGQTEESKQGTRKFESDKNELKSNNRRKCSEHFTVNIKGISIERIWKL